MKSLEAKPVRILLAAVMAVALGPTASAAPHAIPAPLGDSALTEVFSEPFTGYNVNTPASVGPLYLENTGVNASAAAFAVVNESGNDVLELNVAAQPGGESRSNLMKKFDAGYDTGVYAVSAKIKFVQTGSTVVMDLGKPDVSDPFFISTTIKANGVNELTVQSGNYNAASSYSIPAACLNQWFRVDLRVYPALRAYDLYLSGNKLNDAPLKWAAAIYDDVVNSRPISGFRIRTNNQSNPAGRIYFDDVYAGTSPAATVLEPEKDGKYVQVFKEDFTDWTTTSNAAMEYVPNAGVSLANSDGALRWEKTASNANAPAELKAFFTPVSDVAAASVKIKAAFAGASPGISLTLGDGSYEYAAAEIVQAGNKQTTIRANGTDYPAAEGDYLSFGIASAPGRLDILANSTAGT
jgi:hypothetical protein